MLLWLSLLLLCWPLLSHAATYYVSPTGTGTTCAQATALATPHNTVAEGVACMTAGDTLYIRTGTYAEQLNWDKTCTSGGRCTIAGYPGDVRPILMPSSATANAAVVIGGGPAGSSFLTLRDFDIDGINMLDNRGGIAVYRADTTIQGMVIRNIPRTAIGSVGAAFGNYDASRLIVRNNTILNCGRIQPNDEPDTKGIGVYPEGANSLIEGNLIDGCRAGGVEINYEDNVGTIVRNNIIRNAGCSSPWGCIASTWEGGTGRATNPRCITFGGVVSNSNGPTNNYAYNNLCVNIKGTGNQGRCIQFWSASGGGGAINHFVNNTCHNIDTAYQAVNCNTGQGVRIQNNIFSQTTGASCGPSAPLATISNNLTNPTVSATFVNAATGDFRLLAGSPALNIGVAQTAFTTDIVGTTRPQGTAWDVGAYEYLATGAAPNPPTAFELIRQ